MVDFNKEFGFLKIAENLKKEERHCWYSNGRRESVGEHSWRLSLMIIRYAPYLDQKVDLLKSLKLGIIHDLPEAIAGDISITLQNDQVKKQKQLDELKAMTQIRDMLNDDNGQEMYDLWLEFEALETYESKFARAIDKLEAFIQHNEADIKVWEYQKKQMVFQDRYLIKYCTFDSFLLKFAQATLQNSVEKLRANGDDVEAIRNSVESPSEFVVLT